MWSLASAVSPLFLLLVFTGGGLAQQQQPTTPDLSGCLRLLGSVACPGCLSYRFCLPVAWRPHADALGLVNQQLKERFSIPRTSHSRFPGSPASTASQASTPPYVTARPRLRYSLPLIETVMHTSLGPQLFLRSEPILADSSEKAYEHPFPTCLSACHAARSIAIVLVSLRPAHCLSIAHPFVSPPLQFENKLGCTNATGATLRYARTVLCSVSPILLRGASNFRPSFFSTLPPPHDRSRSRAIGGAAFRAQMLIP